jgi:hypothetical protein
LAAADRGLRASRSAAGRAALSDLPRRHPVERFFLPIIRALHHRPAAGGLGLLCDVRRLSDRHDRRPDGNKYDGRGRESAMPSLSCCPSKVPSLLNMALYIWAPTGTGCFHHSFTLSEAGGVWKGNDSDVDVEMGTTGPDPSDLQVKLKLTFNSECGTAVKTISTRWSVGRGTKTACRGLAATSRPGSPS